MNNRISHTFHEMSAAAKGPDGRVYYGWWNILAVYPCVMFIFSTPLVILPLIYPAVEQSLEMTRTEVVAVSSVKFASAAIVAFLAGILIDRLGVRFVLHLCGMVTALGLVYFYFIDSKWMYWLAGIPLGFSSMPLLLVTKTLIARWFNTRLGLAVGLAMAASNVAGIIFPIFYAWLIETVGWNVALPLTSLGIILVVFPVVQFVVKDTPTQEEIESEFSGGGKAGEQAVTQPEEPWPSFSEIARTPHFIIVCILMIAIGFVDQGFTQNITPFMVTDLGFTLQTAALTTSASFLLGLFSKVFFGWLFDWISLKGISICYIMIAISIGLAFGIQGFITLLIFQLARGFAHSGVLIESPILAKHIFGPFHLGKVIGTFSAIAAIGLTFGPITVGKLYELAGNSYYPAFWVLIGIMLICAIVIYFVPPEYRLKKQRERLELEQAAG